MANIPVLGLSSCEHSVRSLRSASVFISTELTPVCTTLHNETLTKVMGVKLQISDR